MSNPDNQQRLEPARLSSAKTRYHGRDTLRTQPALKIDNKTARSVERCTRLIRTAEQELGAFMRTVERVFGAQARNRAAELWLEQLDALDLTLKDFKRDWRRVTISATSRFVREMEAVRQEGRTLTDKSGALGIRASQDGPTRGPISLS